MSEQHPQRLGSKAIGVAVVLEDDKNLPEQEQLNILRAKLKLMTEAFIASRKEIADLREAFARYRSETQLPKKKDLAVGTILYGTTKGQLYLGVVAEGGKVRVGKTMYSSLSAAAEGVSGVRRSGWTFWKLDNKGTPLKEVSKQEEKQADA